jgi:hypothetical protein
MVQRRDGCRIKSGMTDKRRAARLFFPSPLRGRVGRGGRRISPQSHRDTELRKSRSLLLLRALRVSVVECRNNMSAGRVEETDLESERRILAEIKDWRAEGRAERVRQLPLRTAVWFARIAAFAVAVVVVLIGLGAVVTFTSTSVTQGTQSAIPRQR